MLSNTGIAVAIPKSSAQALAAKRLANFMQTVKSTIIWTIIVFVTLTLLTMKNEASSDGLDTYGFPFTYFDHFEGKCDGCYSKFGFKPNYLLIDILFAMTFGFLITIVKSKFYNKSNDKN